jgi:hypothetical protein
MRRVADLIEVLSGIFVPDLRWTVVAGGTDDHFFTMLNVYRGEQRLAGGGMAGPKLYGDSVMNEYRGRTDDLPYVVMARTDPKVDRVVSVTANAVEVDLALSPVIEPFGLRFAAALLPHGERPGSIRAEHAGRILETRSQFMPEPPL